MNTHLPPLAQPIDAEATHTQVEPGSALIVQTRRIRAPRARVWNAWTDPAQLGQWWGPRGFSVTTSLFEFRVGGHWVFTMHGPDPDAKSPDPGGPRDFPNHVVWTRIERGDDAAPWTLEYHHLVDGTVDTVLFTTRVTLEDQAGETLLTWRADFGSTALRDQRVRDPGAARGGQETTARLAQHTEGAGSDATSAAQGHWLVLSRVLPVRRALLWRAWTDPALLPGWFCPVPYRVDRCEIDLRPGGRFYTHMVGPDGFASDNDGSYLEVLPQERLSFTDLLLPDWAPAAAPGLGFTATVLFEDRADGGTKYTAIARHATAAGRDSHSRMGFHDGWGTATDQLLAFARGL